MDNTVIIKKIDILLPVAENYLQHRLIDLKEYLKHEKENVPSLLERYQEIEKMVLDNLSPTSRKNVLKKLEKLDIDGRDYEELVKNYITKINYLQDKVRYLQEKIERIMERPNLFEKEAQKKLDEINSAFREIMKIKDKSSSITEQVLKVSQLEDKLYKMQTDAQLLLNDISTVQLGKQYLEAKNRYCYSIPPKKFSRSKKIYIRYILNCWFYILWIFKRIFQLNFFLYLGFIMSLFLLMLSYILLVFSQSTSYKDLALTIPMLWAAWFFQRKINTREKLFEIYNHKQKVMETYVAFKNSVYTFHAEDKMEDVLLEAIKKDPSDCIGKDNTTLIETILDKLRGLFISRKIEKNLPKDLMDD